MKPIIGVISTPDYDIDKDRNFLVRFEIVEWISKCGGIPISIIPTKICNYFDKKEKNRQTTIQELNNLKQILRMCDGFIKPGGNMIVDYHKYIYKYSIDNDIPFLGICLGMQSMAYAIEENARLVDNNSEIVHKTKKLNAHEILIDENSKLYSILGKKSLIVNSRHNRHIENVNNLLVSAKSLDNQIEALENPNCTYSIGLQWHPESYDFNNQDSKNIFESFIESSIQYTKTKK
ncbi:MAG: gamma-glutamyl-gamma-aminobutyrate hydrolase family protein [Bacilli bacterium]|nr:gamma-glutamyl-gamma-aminobutyrate hydrolase family protein [Bacilli bacterium]